MSRSRAILAMVAGWTIGTVLGVAIVWGTLELIAVHTPCYYCEGARE